MQVASCLIDGLLVTAQEEEVEPAFLEETEGQVGGLLEMALRHLVGAAADPPLGVTGETPVVRLPHGFLEHLAVFDEIVALPHIDDRPAPIDDDGRRSIHHLAGPQGPQVRPRSHQGNVPHGAG